MILSISYTQHNNNLQCHYAECRDVFIAMLNIIKLGVIVLNVVMLSVIMLSVMVLTL